MIHHNANVHHLSSVIQKQKQMYVLMQFLYIVVFMVVTPTPRHQRLVSLLVTKVSRPVDHSKLPECPYSVGSSSQSPSTEKNCLRP